MKRSTIERGEREKKVEQQRGISETAEWSAGTLTFRALPSPALLLHSPLYFPIDSSSLVYYGITALLKEQAMAQFNNL